jgi:hypothetical protein
MTRGIPRVIRSRALQFDREVHMIGNANAVYSDLSPI